MSHRLKLVANLPFHLNLLQMIIHYHIDHVGKFLKGFLFGIAKSEEICLASYFCQIALSILFYFNFHIPAPV